MVKLELEGGEEGVHKELLDVCNRAVVERGHDDNFESECPFLEYECDDSSTCGMCLATYITQKLGYQKKNEEWIEALEDISWVESTASSPFRIIAEKDWQALKERVLEDK